MTKLCKKKFLFKLYILLFYLIIKFTKSNIKFLEILNSKTKLTNFNQHLLN